MIKRSRHESSSTPKQETSKAPKPRDDRTVDPGGGADGQCGRSVPPRRDQPRSVLSLERSLQGRGNRRARDKWSGSRGRRRSGDSRVKATKRTTEDRALRVLDRASVAQKKRQLGLHGDLRGRHLSKPIRDQLLFVIETARDCGETLASICRTLELNPRTVNRWRSGETHKKRHGGGGGKNRLRPDEVDAVVAHADKNPSASVRRIAYDLERKKKVFIGKTKVAEILKAKGMNRPRLTYGKKKEVIPPEDYLLHEPWKPNLLWGMDWTWVRVESRFMFLLVVVDWYSRLIVAWGLFALITQQEVIACVTDAVAKQKIDLLPEGTMRPRIVADHGSANTGKLTRENIEVQGLELWLSGIGRPTGNARTERTIGTLKEEEIKLQDFYSSEQEARRRINQKIWDYNHRRPNAGNGGFAPVHVHVRGRKVLMDQRKKDRQRTANERKEYWNQVSLPGLGLT